MINFLYKPHIKIYFINSSKGIISGNIATLVGNNKVDICNGKSFPIGFFINNINPWEYNDEGRIKVNTGNNEYITDIFEKSEYKINDFLYCSKNGKITNEKKYKDNFIIGVVSSVLENEIGFIHFISRYLEGKE